MTDNTKTEEREVAAIAADANIAQIIQLVRDLERSEQDHDGGMWRVGDSVRAMLGPVGTNRANNGSGRKLSRIAAASKQAGCKHCSVAWFRLLWMVSDRWPHAKRFTCAPWAAHLKARSFEILRDAIAAARQAPGGAVPVTASSVEKFRVQRQHEEAQRQRREAGIADPRPSALTLAIFDLPRDPVRSQQRARFWRGQLERFPAQLTPAEVENLSRATERAAQAFNELTHWLRESGARELMEAAE